MKNIFVHDEFPPTYPPVETLNCVAAIELVCTSAVFNSGMFVVSDRLADAIVRHVGADVFVVLCTQLFAAHAPAVALVAFRVIVIFVFA